MGSTVGLDLTKLAGALKAGKVGGADVAELLSNVVGPSTDLRLVAESLQAACAVLRGSGAVVFVCASCMLSRTSQPLTCA